MNDSSVVDVDSTATEKPKGPIRLLELARDLRYAVNENDWRQVDQLSGRCLTEGYLAVRNFQWQGLPGADRKRSRKPEQQTSLTAEKITQMVDAVRQHLSVGEEDLLGYKSYLENSGHGDTQDSSNREEFDKRAGKYLKTRHGDWQNAVLACISRGALGKVHSAFNLEHQKHSQNLSAGISPLFSEETFKGELDKCEEQLNSLHLDIYSALTKTNSVNDACSSLEAMVSWVERSLPGFARLQATATVGTAFLLDSGKGSRAEKLGKLTARAGLLCKQLISSHCAGYRLLLNSDAGTADKDIKDFIRLSPRRAFTGALPDGKNVELDELDSLEDNTYVDVEGFIVGMRVQRMSDGKLTSHIRLQDPSSGGSAYAASIFTHLPHIGLTRGAYCCLTGHYKKSSVIFEKDRPVIEVDRMSLKELENNNWQIAFYNLSNNWFSPWRNGTHIRFSLGIHQRGDDAGKSNFHGASELVAPKFFKA